MISEDPIVSAIFKEENDINAAFWKKRALVRRSSFQRAIGTFSLLSSRLHFHRRVHNARLPRRRWVYQFISAKNVSRAKDIPVRSNVLDVRFWDVFQRLVGRPFRAVGIRGFILTSVPENNTGHNLFIHGVSISAGVNHVHYSRVWCGHVGVCNDRSTSRFDFIERVPVSRTVGRFTMGRFEFNFTPGLFRGAGIRKSWKQETRRPG